MTDQQWQDQHLIFERAIRHIIQCPVPVIAAVNGAAYAGGMEIALCADFIYAAENARFALTEVTLGIMPGAGGTQNLPRAVGGRRAKEILLTGKPFTVQQAFEWGMVNRICKAGHAAGRGAGDRATIAAQRADLDPADQAVGGLRAEHGPRQRHDVRDRGLQPHGARPRTAARASARSTRSASRSTRGADHRATLSGAVELWRRACAPWKRKMAEPALAFPSYGRLFRAMTRPFRIFRVMVGFSEP